MDARGLGSVFLGRAQRDTKDHLLATIAGHIDWLVREQTGEFLTGD